MITRKPKKDELVELTGDVSRVTPTLITVGGHNIAVIGAILRKKIVDEEIVVGGGATVSYRNGTLVTIERAMGSTQNTLGAKLRETETAESKECICTPQSGGTGSRPVPTPTVTLPSETGTFSGVVGPTSPKVHMHNAEPNAEPNSTYVPKHPIEISYYMSSHAQGVNTVVKTSKPIDLYDLPEYIRTNILDQKGVWLEWLLVTDARGD